ncbi:MAG: epimerase [Cohnella sp.]|jgi:putative NADH-flavin reductase|nr:epimerase [Cohnella sp.]
MKITVFGATGGIGQEIVRQGLAAGHQVTAVVRDPARFTVTGDALDVFTSSLLDDPEALREAVAGRDAVLSGLGARSRKDAGITAPLTRTVLRAMELTEVRRLLVVSAAPLGPVPQGEPFLLGRIVTPLVKALLKDIYADLKVMEEELERSATDWTSVRPPRLMNRPVTGVYRTAVEANLRGGSSIGRADVAHAMLAMIHDPAVVKHAVGVAY